MCGIAGYWAVDRRGAGQLVVAAMACRLAHRGPDDSGTWLDEQGGLALGHQRLAVIDLSTAGHQPMVSPCGRYVIAYNGEIYNHLDLRLELEREGGHFDWRSHSDTETLLAGLRHWGVEVALNRLNGMFAFALWDRVERTLFLARDRMGEKPLYYGHSGGTFLFGSELKSLAAHPNWNGTVDRKALTLYLRYSYVPSPWSIYQGIAKLPPAHYITVREQGKEVSAPRCYWDLGQIAERGVAEARGEPAELITDLDRLLRDAIGRRMAADVPLGAFLSGGYDSTTIVALMQVQSTQPVKTFSVGFGEAGFDEAPHAQAVANYLGTSHTELNVSAQQAQNVIPRIPAIWDEPFADASQIPTFLVAELARRDVSVSLSGDGGDELFGGYNRHYVGPRLWRTLRWFPSWSRSGLGMILQRLPSSSVYQLARAFTPAKKQFPQLDDKLQKVRQALGSRRANEFYRRLVSLWDEPIHVVRDAQEPASMATTSTDGLGLGSLLDRMMYLDMVRYLPDDILTKTDRATMAMGLEARVPLLDHRIVEFAWRVPQSVKIRDGQGKWLLRQVLYRYVPQHLMDRPKQGFTVPIGQWLRGPLREWAETLLGEQRLREEGYFQPGPIRRMWKEHLSGHRNWQDALWCILMFQAWLEASSDTRYLSRGQVTA